MKLIPKGLQDRLAKMIGKSYSYQGRHVEVLQTRLSDTVEIVTREGWLTFPLRTASQELQKFSPLPVSALVESKPVGVALYESNGAMQVMRESILHVIEKLKSEPGFVPQAHAINDVLLTAIAMGKMEIEAARLNWQMQEAAQK